MKYVVSDLHGEYGLFVKLLKLINFSSSDQLYVCGDIIDKGAESVRLAKLLFSMPNAKCIAGNHELAFLTHYWVLMKETEDFDGVLSQLQSYFSDGHLLDWKTVDAIESLPYFIEEEGFICVHAGIPLDAQGRLTPLDSVTEKQFVFDRTFKEPFSLPKDGKCVFFGHTPTNYITGKSEIITYPKNSNPRSIKDYYKIHLDTGTWLDGVLGCFCVDTCKKYYVKK